jgi:hypothetical protein
VRIECATRADAEAFEERLKANGDPVIRRSTYLLVGARNRDEARALAERLRAEAPQGSRLHVEPGSGVAWQLLPRNPFAIFGGLGT